MRLKDRILSDKYGKVLFIGDLFENAIPGSKSAAPFMHRCSRISPKSKSTVFMLVLLFGKRAGRSPALLTLSAGDSFSYKPSVQHYLANPGKTPATVLWVSTPPNF